MLRTAALVLGLGSTVLAAPAALAQSLPSPEPSAPASGVPAISTSPSPSASTTPPAPLALAKTKLQLNPGASSSIPILGGVAPYSVAFASVPPIPRPILDTAPPLPESPTPPNVATSDLATASIDPVASTLVIHAASAQGGGSRPPAGTTFVVVTDATGASVATSLLVGPNAGFVPATVALSLVGSPSQEFVSVQIEAALRRAASALPGVSVVVGPQVIPSAIPAGQTVAIPVKVHLDGAQRYVDIDGIATARITVASAPPIVPQTLFYSDDPETLKADGILFRGVVTAQHPVRLYYYHQALTPGHEVAVALDAPAGSARVTVVGHGAGPNPAVFFVGQNATYRYLDDHARGSGIAFDVPVGAPVIISAGASALEKQDLVAGVLDLAVTEGDPVRLTVLSFAPGTDPRALLGGDELPSDGYRRRGAYDLSLTTPIALSERLPAVSDLPVPPVPEPTVLIAQPGTAIANLRPGGRALAGDYGLLHPVMLTLGNDTDAAGTLYLYEQPVVGYPVTTTIEFDGDPMPTKLQCVKTRTNRYLIRSFAIAPHATTIVTGSYMTDGGSTYPIAFGLTATPPIPPPLTMTEADGCFPKPGSSAPAAPAPSPRPTAGT